MLQSGYCVDNNCCMPCDCVPCCVYTGKKQYEKKISNVIDFITPMWINFTLRIAALKEILTFIEGNLAFHPFMNTIIGMTYDFLPFMILPLYNTISKLDKIFWRRQETLVPTPARLL